MPRGLEVNADAPLYIPWILRHAVHPIFLAPSSHDDQVAGSGFEGNGVASAAGLYQEAARRAQREYRDDAVGPSNVKSVAMPGGTVLSITIEIQPKPIVRYAVMP